MQLIQAYLLQQRPEPKPNKDQDISPKKLDYSDIPTQQGSNHLISYISIRKYFKIAEKTIKYSKVRHIVSSRRRILPLFVIGTVKVVLPSLLSLVPLLCSPISLHKWEITEEDVTGPLRNCFTSEEIPHAHHGIPFAV